MWALVTDGSITKIINQPKPLVIGDTQYSRNIFLLDGVMQKEKLLDFMK